LKKIFLIVILSACVSVPAFASQGDIERGKRIYDKRCWWCHGAEGMGDGPASEFLVPPPADFTSAAFKFKSTPFDEIMTAGTDLFKAIKGGSARDSIAGWRGLNDTSMPGWADVLTDPEIWDLVEYIRALSGLEPPEKGPISYIPRVPTSLESIAMGRELFEDRCVECHGKQGRGDGEKRLKDDRGFRTWPVNLTKGWSFRVSSDPQEIFTRITVGIPGTQMPSYADPENEKSLTVEQRWHVANYVASLDEPYKKPGDNTVIRAVRVDGGVSLAADDPLWERAPYTSFYMVPQIVAGERHFTPSVNSISVKALYNDSSMAILLEWDDRTETTPGDRTSEEIAGGVPFKDAVSVQFPISIAGGSEKPSFAMGDKKRPVNIWYWNGQSIKEPQAVRLINAAGFVNIVEREPGEAGLEAAGSYSLGTWRVVMRRPLRTQTVKDDIQFAEGTYIPIAFAAWDGSNFEEGSKHVLTTWYWLILEPVTGAGLYIWPVFIGLVVAGGELLWLRSARKRQTP
jgi:DMSO reductase family type II enzyme heme b subunit